MGRRISAWALACATLATASHGAAHGRFPASGQVAIHASDAQHLLVRTTYGLIVSPDGGDSWRWICPEVVGFDADKEDPAVAVMGDTSLLAGTFDGMARGAEAACSWAIDAGEMAGRYVVDLQREADANQALALTSNGLAADTFDVRLWQTSDSGASWAQVGVSPPSDFLATTLAAAPSRIERVYLAGRDGMGSYQGAVMRSDDRGGSWTRLAVPGTDDGATLPHLGGVHPTDPNALYLVSLREDAGEVVYFELLHSSDGGDSWSSIATRNDAVSAFALSPDGSEVAFGGRNIGLWVASSADHQFAQRSTLHVGCLTWTDAGLYACADPFTDGYVLARSHDGGASFEPLMDLGSPCGPPACPADSEVSSICGAKWPEEAKELTAPASCDGAGGGSSSSSASSSSSGSAATPGGDGGCGCRMAGTRGSASLGGWLALLGWSAWRRRRRRQASLAV
jgi:photosystem II stability/assembly factor-like uncharacterized protein